MRRGGGGGAGHQRVYAAGGRRWDKCVGQPGGGDKPLTLRSVNGPELTVIDGGGSVRCVYLASEASLSGFTLTWSGRRQVRIEQRHRLQLCHHRQFGAGRAAAPQQLPADL